jgi:asparaginyl-tRNA synthetase
METIRVEEALRRDPCPEPVRVRGWVRTRRDSKSGFSFLEINDGSCLRSLQVLADRRLPNYEEELLQLTTGCSVEVQGPLKESPGKGQAVELHADSIRWLGACDAQAYPLQKKHHSFEFLRQVAHLRARTNTFGAVFRVRNRLSRSIHDFFQERGFLYLQTPVITPMDCEGAGELFRVTTLDPERLPRDAQGRVNHEEDFFGRQTFLTVSGQLEAEALACALGNVYTFGPTFRAENSNTTRHLSEFWMVEPEMAFCDLEQDMDTAESFLKVLLNGVLCHCREDLAFFDLRIQKGLVENLEKIRDSRFRRISYTEAIAVLRAASRPFQFPPEWGKDLQSEHERFLTEEVFSGPVIVYDYPELFKPFYMYRNDDGKTVRAMDVLVPRAGEIIGGSQREDRLDVLAEKIRSLGMNPDAYQWFLDLRRFGPVPHAGFGLGFDRFVQFVTGMQNIRDVIPFPRTPKSAPF